MGAVIRSIRFAQTDNSLDIHKNVCIAVFAGDALSRQAFGANQARFALRLVTKLRAQGQAARAEWINVGPWCADLWTQDLMRPLGMHPDRFYGELEREEVTQVTKRIPLK